MKNIFLGIVATLMLITACQQKSASNATESNASNTAAAQELSDGSFCFEHAVGQDTTFVKLIITGNDVSGQMNWGAYEKDGANGTLQGTRNGNEISAIWTYVIEGSNQTEEVMFKIEGDQLMRKVGELEDSNNDGNLKLKDPANATYSETFVKVTCS